MARILVLYYSSYGHVETMARAVAEGAESVQGVQAVVKRVPELVPEAVARGSGMKLEQDADVASPQELGDYDAVIVGTPTRFGNMAAQMRNFWDQTGALWVQGALVGKLGSCPSVPGPGPACRRSEAGEPSRRVGPWPIPPYAWSRSASRRSTSRRCSPVSTRRQTGE